MKAAQSAPPPGDLAIADAVLAAALFAVDPFAIGGVHVRAAAGPLRDQWLAFVRGVLPSSAPFRRMPLSIAENRLLGGLDLATTLRIGHPVAEQGLLADIDGGALVVPMAERLQAPVAAHLGAALDTGIVRLEREGISTVSAARFGVLALDEGLDDERAPTALTERLGLALDLTGFPAFAATSARYNAACVKRARDLLANVHIDDAFVAVLCAVAARLGIGSPRAVLFAVRVARTGAALAGRIAVVDEDVACAARLVLAPRATMIPDMPQMPEAQTMPPNNAQNTQPLETAETAAGSLDDLVLAAAKAAIPERLLADLTLAGVQKARARSVGHSGRLRQTPRFGRPAGTRRGELRGGARLNLIGTLRAAAPWQALRRDEAERSGQWHLTRRVQVRPDDFRVTRFKQRMQSVAIFVVDASGSSALNRLAEVKGAIELLLAECYLRRDQVALIAFRDRAAEVVLPPTRSLVRAKRSLAALPGGGGTPLAAAIESATMLAEAQHRRGQTPIVILMTDGQANVARDGSRGRTRAEDDALAAARRLRFASLPSMVIDTSPRGQAQTARIAGAMAAPYIALPHADSAALSRTILATSNGRE